MNLCLHAETNNDTLLASALWGQDISCAKLEKRKTFKQSLFLLLPNIMLRSVINHESIVVEHHYHHQPEHKTK